ncbi:right-handed parallel beta-helix repeat-containing protein [Streptomyces sp. M19]
MEDNDVHDQPNGAGIAVFDSSDDIIRRNTVTRAKYGMRFSVGAQSLTLADNTVTDSGSTPSSPTAAATSPTTPTPPDGPPGCASPATPSTAPGATRSSSTTATR